MEVACYCQVESLLLLPGYRLVEVCEKLRKRERGGGERRERERGGRERERERERDVHLPAFIISISPPAYAIQYSLS